MSALAWFLLKVAAAALPLAALAWFGRIYPHRRFVLIALVPGLLSIGLIGTREVLPVLLALDGLFALLACLDLFTLPRHRVMTVERSTGRIASLKVRHPVTLTVSHFGRLRRHLHIKDDIPDGLTAMPAEFRARADAKSRVVLHYQLQSQRRGAFTLPQVHISVRSRLGLWRRILKYETASVVNVYPDLKQVSQYALLARQNRLSLLGMRKSRRVGGDNEFERLRDYTRDDNFKHIDWRSTARRGKLTVKDFQTDQSQRLIFLIDCGRMMVNRAADLSLLDHSLNAMLMLSYVALAHGDQVGLMTFSDDIHGFVPPQGGMRHMTRLLHESYDRFPRLVESRYDRAFLYLGSHCRKRSLVMLMTNVIDEVNGSQVEEYLTTLVGRHLPMGVLLRDRRVFDFAEAAQVRGPALYRAAAASEILLWRQQVLADLERKGVLSLDVFPDELTAPLVNRYLEIKARHLL